MIYDRTLKGILYREYHGFLVTWLSFLPAGSCGFELLQGNSEGSDSFHTFSADVLSDSQANQKQWHLAMKQRVDLAIMLHSSQQHIVQIREREKKIVSEESEWIPIFNPLCAIFQLIYCVHHYVTFLFLYHYVKRADAVTTLSLLNKFPFSYMNFSYFYMFIQI